MIDVNLICQEIRKLSYMNGNSSLKIISLSADRRSKNCFGHNYSYQNFGIIFCTKLENNRLNSSLK